MQTYELRRYLSDLRAKFPTPIPVVVRRARLKGENGFVRRRKGHFLIVLNRGMSRELTAQILYHEWAHVLTWDSDKNHDRRWAAVYSRIYREMIDPD